MEWVEVTGKSLEEAKELALDQLGVDEQDAEFEILEEPRAGLFGRLRSEARVRARVLPTAPRPKLERRRRGRPGGERAPASKGGGEVGAEPRRRGGRGRERGASGGEANAAGERRERARADRSAGGVEATVSEADAAAEPSLEDQGGAAEEFLRGLLDAIELDGTVGIREVGDEYVEVAVEGNDLGLLIGPRGQTLAAVQELARTVVQRKLGARSGRLLVDVGDYRKKRRAALERFTRQVADEVRASGVTRVLEAMPPADRKVIHDTVNDLPGVRTTSEGEEPNRRVAIVPLLDDQSGDAGDEADNRADDEDADSL